MLCLSCAHCGICKYQHIMTAATGQLDHVPLVFSGKNLTDESIELKAIKDIDFITLDLNCMYYIEAADGRARK